MILTSTSEDFPNNGKEISNAPIDNSKNNQYIYDLFSEPPEKHLIPEKQLISAVKNGSKEIVELNMRQEKLIDLEKNPEINTIYTYGLGGCNAVSIITKNKNGNIIALMSHYPPISLSGQCNNLEKLLIQNKENIDFDTHTEIAIVVPGNWEQINNKWVMTANNGETINKLQKSITTFFKNNKLTIIPYGTVLAIGQSQAFIINFPKDKGELIRYQALTEYGNFGPR